MLGGGGGAGGYNSAFILDRGTEQVKRNGQVGVFTEGGNTIIFHECENSSESRFELSFLHVHVHVYFKLFLQSNCKEIFFQNFPFCSLRKKVTPKSLLFCLLM